jgi:hypothetical protein
MQEMIDIVTSVGFPIACCVYLLYERDRRTKQLTEAVTELRIAIEKLGGGV